MKIELSDEVYSTLATLVMESNKSASQVIGELLAEHFKPKTGVKTMPSAGNHALLQLTESEEYKKNNGIGKYLLLLTNLYKAHPNEFHKLEQFPPGKRVYFSRSPEKIIQSGKSMKATKIPDSPYFMFPGIENKTKRKIISGVLALFNYPAPFCSKIAETIEDSGITRSHTLVDY